MLRTLLLILPQRFRKPGWSALWVYPGFSEEDIHNAFIAIVVSSCYLSKSRSFIDSLSTLSVPALPTRIPKGVLLLITYQWYHRPFFAWDVTVMDSLLIWWVSGISRPNLYSANHYVSHLLVIGVVIDNGWFIAFLTFLFLKFSWNFESKVHPWPRDTVFFFQDYHMRSHCSNDAIPWLHLVYSHGTVYVA